MGGTSEEHLIDCGFIELEYHTVHKDPPEYSSEYSPRSLVLIRIKIEIFAVYVDHPNPAEYVWLSLGPGKNWHR